jgi:cytidylate kinase
MTAPARFVVAIDGPAAAGKGTIARAVAARFGFAHLDTGLLYRATAARVLASGADPGDAAAAAAAARGLTAPDLARDDLRSEAVAEGASKVAVIPDVRAALLDFQRDFAARKGGAVLDGRDIGTVVCPAADVKLFVTASAEVRAARRALEFGLCVDAVLDDLRRRDARDAGRASAPLMAAPDAHLLDTSDLGINAAVAKATALIEKKLNEARARDKA